MEGRDLNALQETAPLQESTSSSGPRRHISQLTPALLLAGFIEGAMLGGFGGATYGAWVGLLYGATYGPITGLFSGALVAIVNGVVIGALAGISYELAAFLWLDVSFPTPKRGLPGAMLGCIIGLLAGMGLWAWDGVVVGAIYSLTYGAGIGAWTGGLLGIMGGPTLFSARSQVVAVLVGIASGPFVGMLAAVAVLGNTMVALVIGALAGLCFGPLVGAIFGLVRSWLRGT